MTGKDLYLSDPYLWDIVSIDAIQLDIEEEAIESGREAHEIDVVCTSLDLVYRFHFYR